MELKSVAQLEVVANERVYRLIIPNNAPLGECYDAVFQMLMHINRLSTEAIHRAEPKTMTQDQFEKAVQDASGE